VVINKSPLRLGIIIKPAVALQNDARNSTDLSVIKPVIFAASCMIMRGHFWLHQLLSSTGPVWNPSVG